MPSSDFTPNNVWGSSAPTSVPVELTLPSGQTCLARRLGIEGVVQTGLIAEVDVLTQMVDKHTRLVKGGKGTADGQQVDMSILKDPEALSAIIGLTDRLMPHIVVSPPILPHWTERTVGKTRVTKMISVEDREDGRIYTDMIGLEDKMHLFEWAVGGLTEFSSFRRESDDNVGSVGPVERPRKSAKRRPRNR